MRFAIFPIVGSQEEVALELPPEKYSTVVLKPKIRASYSESYAGCCYVSLADYVG